MATFKQLQDRVKTRIIDLPDEVVAELPALVNEAIRDAQDAHNYRIMEHTIEFTTQAGVRLLGTLPFYKETRGEPWVRHDDGGETEIEWAHSMEDVIKLFSVTAPDDEGRPAQVLEAAVDDDNNMELEVYPFPSDDSDHPDGDWRVNVPYWRYLAPLVNDPDMNWFTNNGEKFIVLQATALAMELNRDYDDADRYFLRAASALKVLEGVDKRSKLKTNLVLIPRRDVHANTNQRRL